MHSSTLDRRNILVVEDDYMIAQDVALEVEQVGGTVIGPVPSVDEALRCIAEDHCDAAILDVNLGHEDSFPIARTLQARGIPFVFATGYNSADIPPEWRHVTAVVKPLRVAGLVRLLAGSLAK